MLKVSQLDVSIGPVGILRKIDLDLQTGQMAGLIGRNGAGKTTFMRSLMGLLPARHGSIVFDGVELTRAPAYLRPRLGIGYMPEDRRLVPELTVQENICVPSWAMKRRDTAARWEQVCDMIPELRDFAGRRGQQLSGGQQKLAAIGRALMVSSTLLLDEPFEGVAPALARRISEVIAELKRSSGLSIIVSESDLQHSAGLLDRVFRIERGEVSED